VSVFFCLEKGCKVDKEADQLLHFIVPCILFFNGVSFLESNIS
jgi:hypothetical protein